MKISIIWRTGPNRFPIGPSYRVSAMKTDPWWRHINGLRIDLPHHRTLHIELFDPFRRGPLYWNRTRSTP